MILSSSDSTDTKVAAFNRMLHGRLPGAELGFQAVPECNGLNLLLIQPGFDPRLLSGDQLEKLSDDPPYWIFCWASGRAMARRILAGRLDVRDKVVADFGAGSGVVAIAAKMAGAKRGFACDIDATCRELTQLNAAFNQVDVEVVSSLDEVQCALDLVVASDVLYEAANLRFLDMMLGVCADVLVADSRLKSMPDKRFRYIDRVYTTSFPDYQEALENNEVRFYRSQWPPSGSVAEAKET